MDEAEEQRVFLLLLDEIEETLSDFERRCLQLEHAASREELKVIFRAAHNIKGGSRLFGLNEFGHFVHSVEDLLNALSVRGAAVEAKSVDLLLKAHSVMSDWTKALRQDRKTVFDTSELVAEIQAHGEELKKTPPPQASGTAAEAAPAPQPELELEPEPAPAAEPAAESAPAPTVEPGPGAATPAPIGVSEGDGSRGGPAWKGQPQRRKRAGSLRIASQKIDEIMQLIGELSIHESIIWHGQLTNTLNSGVCREAITMNQKVLKELHNLVLSLRMQPVESLFQRVERTARDLARLLNKKIQVTLVGSEVLLDKTVIELMVDPMMHLVRNAVDHGIEDEETRKSAGKPISARLKIEAHHDAGQVVISITDDGGGIDPQVIREKAVQRGLIRPDAGLSDEEATQLIFLAGFSTREQVTEISGRGVGLDVVQQAIQQIGGVIQTRSKIGAGTLFQIWLPTSLEVIEGLVVRVGETNYIAPRQDVVEIVDLSSFNVERLGQNGWAINLRDQVVPVEDLAEYIGDDRAKSDPAPDGAPFSGPGKNIALVIRLPNQGRLALRIDQVVSQQQIVVRPLSDKLASVPGFTGATILGDGEPGLILSTSFISECYMTWISRARKPA